MADKILSMISLAAAAGKISSGQALVESAVRSGKCSLVLTAGDASANTRKSCENMCKYYNVPLRIYATREEFGKYTGKGFRAALAVMDSGFAGAIIRLIDQEAVSHS